MTSWFGVNYWHKQYIQQNHIFCSTGNRVGISPQYSSLVQESNKFWLIILMMPQKPRSCVIKCLSWSRSLPAHRPYILSIVLNFAAFYKQWWHTCMNAKPSTTSGDIRVWMQSLLQAMLTYVYECKAFHNQWWHLCINAKPSSTNGLLSLINQSYLFFVGLQT